MAEEEASLVVADEIHLYFGAVIFQTGTLIPYKNAQKQGLQKEDYYGSKALKEQVEQWDKLIPTRE